MTHELNLGLIDGGLAIAQRSPSCILAAVSNGIEPQSAAVAAVGVPCVRKSLTLSYGIKTLEFTWPAVSGATHYRLLENPDGVSGFVQVGSDITGTSVSHPIALHRRVNARYIVSACNSGGCADSAAIALAGNLIPAIGYGKASNTGAGDQLGYALALSADGSTLAVGAYNEANNATGINGNQANNSASFSGAVYTFIRSGSTWTQQAYVKALNTETSGFFVRSRALRGWQRASGGDIW